MPNIRYKTRSIDGINIFFREAGVPSKPAVILLHGFPSSSHQYRELIPLLAEDYYVIAPDYPGFGYSSAPDRSTFEYTFDALAKYVQALIDGLGVSNYALMMQDYGAPVGFRIASADPTRITGLIIQNGNAYEEGVNLEAFSPIIAYWNNPTPELGQVIVDSVFSREGIQWQYTTGVRQPERISPDSWNHDFERISRPGNHDIQLDLLYDYQNNIRLYPKWQACLKENQHPTLIVWGKNDPFFPESGAEAYLRDLKDVDYHILETGHFALEEDLDYIAEQIKTFMATKARK